MEEENSNKIDVSYGVEKPEESAELNAKEADDNTVVNEKVKKKSSKNKSSKSKKAKDVASSKEEKPKKKVSLLDQIEKMKANGDVNSPEFRSKIAELEVVLGIDEISMFGTNELDVFEDKLKSMTYADMKDMAYTVGLNPFMPHQRMKTALLQHFKDTNKNNMRNVMPGPANSIELDPDNPKHAEALKILGEI